MHASVFLLRYSLIPTWENKQMQLRRVHPRSSWTVVERTSAKTLPTLVNTVHWQSQYNIATAVQLCAPQTVFIHLLCSFEHGETLYTDHSFTHSRTRTHCWRLKVFRCYRENTEQCLNGTERVCRTYSTRPLCFSDFKPRKTCSAAHIHS